MGVEAFFAAREGGIRRPLADYARMLINAGHRCLEEPDQWGRWLVFPGHESALNFSVEDGAAVFATFDISDADPPEFLSDIERLFAEAGWITSPAEDR